jgi:regulator of CtrA degradation
MTMAEQHFNNASLVPFGVKLAASPAFSGLFRDGMKLVEETAAYLDGPGRQACKRLQRQAALSYATESMRLTTRLMQLASWLLLHRAVNEGEISLAQTNKEKTKVRLGDDDTATGEVLALLPETLVDLIQRTARLQSEIRRLDATIHAPPPEALARTHPLDQQIGLLKAAFERADS